MTMKEKKNPFVFMFIMAAMSAIMYCIAFHEQRNKVHELEKKIELLKLKI
jgi:preprotein translocase subunit YajC